MAKPKSGGEKKPRAPRATPRTKASAPGADQVQGPGKGHNKTALSPDAEQSLFIQHRSSWNQWKAKRKVVDKIEDDVKAALKADGFTVKQFEIADSLQSPKGEKKITHELSDRIKVATWLGHPLGAKFAQMDLFNQGEAGKPVSVDAAYEQGKVASKQNEARRPPYAPETDNYKSWMRGYNDDQGRMMAEGFKRPADTGQNDGGSGEGGSDETNGEGGTPPADSGAPSSASGEYISRSEMNRRLEEAAKHPTGKPH